MKWETLAPELIFEILSQFLPEFKKLSVVKPHSFPWYLGQICSSWRRVFTLSPQFWGTLTVNLTPYDPQWSPKRILEVAKISMLRSGGYPISFVFRFGPSSLYASFIICQQILEVLVANSARWRDVYMSIPTDKMATIYAAKCRMPMLRSILLLLNHGMDEVSDAVKLYDDFLMDAPQLTRIFFDDNFALWKIDWSLITVVHIRTTKSPSQLLYYLSQTCCLTELAFIGGAITLPNTIIPINLPHLKILYCSVVTVLRIVETPALQELHIRNDLFTVEDESVLKATVSSYFQQIPHLLKLPIFSCDWRDAAVMIEHMPRVDHLSLFSWTLADLLELLDDCSQMCHLKTLTFVLSIVVPARDRILKTVTSWKREPGEDRGIGPFQNLTQMSFKSLMASHHNHYVNTIKSHLEEQGLECLTSEHEWGDFIPEYKVL